jgi:hypothetical protein
MRQEKRTNIRKVEQHPLHVILEQRYVYISNVLYIICEIFYISCIFMIYKI